MRVSLPGRDYFPPRVLLRGAPRPAMEDFRGDGRLETASMPMLPAAMPALPPAPVVSLRPAAA